jgi:hypothetical protein
MSLSPEDFPARHTKAYCYDTTGQRVWRYDGELGTKATHDLPPASGGILRPQQPPVGWSIHDAVGATASPADEGEGSLGVEDPSWADLGVGDTDAVAGDADVAPWMVTGAAAVAELLAERARRSLNNANTDLVSLYDEVTAVANRVQDVPALMRDLCTELECAWPEDVGVPPFDSTTRLGVLEFAASAVAVASSVGRQQRLRCAVAAIGRRVDQTHLPAVRRIERHSHNVLRGRKKARRSSGSDDESGDGGGGSK